MIFRKAATSFFFLIFVSPGAFGHHSFAATFASDVIVELEGEVTAVRWRNPHVGFTLKIVDSSGAEALWDMESHSLSIMRRMDLATAFIYVGDRVKVAGNLPRRSDINAMFVQNILLPSGEEWVFKFGASPADLRWSDRLMGTTERWFATEGEASGADRGIFRVWSTALASGGGRLRRSSYPLTETARAAVAEFDPVEDSPLANCAPKGMSYIMTQPYPMEFVEQNDTILLRIEEYDTVRTIYMDSAAPAAGQLPSILGHSVGHWEDDTLVVRTTGVNYAFFDGVTGIPQSDAVEFVERITAVADGSRLDYRITVTDPATFTEPVVLENSWIWLSDVTVEPYECTVGG
jgi:hypothetical protein